MKALDKIFLQGEADLSKVGFKEDLTFLRGKNFGVMLCDLSDLEQFKTAMAELGIDPK